MMTSTKLPMALWVAATLSVAQCCIAGDVATFDSCTDVAGRTIAAEIDYAQTHLVRTTLDAGQPAIRYNPALLPGLTPNARQFFYAHECARHSLGDAGKADLPLTRVRQADCVALATLLTSGLLKRDQVAALQGQLNYSAAEWEALPGPPRGFDLAACRTGGVLRLPAATSPSARQAEWNAAMRACADRLWTCQKGCRGEACVSDCVASHRQCETNRGDAPRNSP
jgi:hypothetical protein